MHPTNIDHFNPKLPPPASAPTGTAIPPSPAVAAGSTNHQFCPPTGPWTVPQGQTQVPSLPAPWSTGLFDCCDDVGNCCVTCFCPCVTFGQIAEILDKGSVSCCASGALYTLVLCVTGCQCLYSCFYRSKMRGEHSLEESPCADCLVHCCCEGCALCQEYRELKSRGFFLHYLGWEGSLVRQRATLPPGVEGGMRR